MAMVIKTALSFQEFHEVYDRLSPEDQRRVSELASLFLDGELRRKQQHPRLDWAGGLKEFSDQYESSVDAEARSIDWRGD
jgi:hypothetical protein